MITNKKRIVFWAVFLTVAGLFFAWSFKRNEHVPVQTVMLGVGESYSLGDAFTTYTHLNSSFELRSKEFFELKNAAMTGDSVASFRLAQYYLYIVSDRKSYKYWLEKSAADGNLNAQYSLAYNLYQDSRGTQALSLLNDSEIQAINNGDRRVLDLIRSLKNEIETDL